MTRTNRVSSIGRCLFCVAALLVVAAAHAHGGGLDGYGCHHNRKQGGYHCHRGPLAGQTFANQQEMLEALKRLQEKQKAEKPEPPSL